MTDKQAIEAPSGHADAPRTDHAGGGLRRGGRRVIAVVEVVEDVVHYAVAVLLVGVAVAVLVSSVVDVVHGRGHPFAERVTAVINGVLFVIIVMEILRTVVAHFDSAGLQLKPFLIIGIISAVRHILTIGAQVSLGADGGDADHFRRAQTELGVNAAVVIALVIGLVLVWHSEEATDEAKSDTTQT